MLLNLAHWRTNAETVIERVFADDGLLSQKVAGYVRNPDQVKYAMKWAQSLLHRFDNPGQVALLQGGTGTGKTLGYLIPLLIDAVLTKTQNAVSTYTIALQRQILSKDGQIAIKVVEALTGKTAKIAVRNARSRFACPNKVERFVEEIRKVNHHHPDIDFLESLRDFSLKANILLEENSNMSKDEIGNYILNGYGLIDAWAEGDNDRIDFINRTARDMISLDQDSQQQHQLSWRFYLNQTKDADCIVLTHAATIIDLSLYGLITGAHKKAFGAMVVDEAHKLEDAARSVLGRKVALHPFAWISESIKNMFAAKNIQIGNDEEAVIAISDNVASLALGLVEKFVKMECKGHFIVKGNESWLDDIKEMHSEMEKLVIAYNTLDIEDDDMPERIVRLYKGLDMFFETVTKSQKGEHSFESPLIDFSPIRQRPSLSLEPKRGARIASRLWKEKNPLSQLTLFTSATLALAGNREPNFSNFIDTIGLKYNISRLNSDFSGIIEPKKFGEPHFIFTSPDTPLPSIKSKEGVVSSPEWISHVARAIQEAAVIKGKEGNCNIMCLTTSFSDAHLIAKELPENLSSRLIVRDRGEMSLHYAMDQYMKKKDAILISPGAWEGVDPKGKVDHLIISRLPYAPPSPVLMNAVFTYKDKETGDEMASNGLSTMINHFIQGLGRAIRYVSDSPYIWILDVRVGLPEALEQSHVIQRSKHVEPMVLRSLPPRFNRMFRHARLFSYQKIIEKKKSAKKEKA